MSSRPLAPQPVSAAGTSPGRAPIGVGRRGFLLLAAGLLLIVPAWTEPRTLWLMLVWDAIVAMAWLGDLRGLPRPENLRVTRSWSGPLGLGQPARVTLSVDAGEPGPIDAEAIDDLPTPLRQALPRLSLATGPAGQGAASYDVHPRERGDHQMGSVLLRYTGRRGLAVRWARFALSQSVRVYPDLHEARRHSLYLVRSRQVALEKRRARQHGHGREFDSLRDFRDGDEPRDICWTATARRGRLVTRVFVPERSQAVWILVDAGRLLRAHVAGRSQLDHAVHAALSLAQVALGSGDRVGLLAYGRRPTERLPPRRGALHLRALVEALTNVRAEPFEADHATAAGTVLALQKRRALIVWLTDVADTADVPDVVESSRQMAPRHVVLLAMTRHPELAAAASARPDTTLAMYRVMAAQESLERRERLLHGLRQRGVLTLEMAPGELSAALVDRYLAIKERSVL